MPRAAASRAALTPVYVELPHATKAKMDRIAVSTGLSKRAVLQRLVDDLSLDPNGIPLHWSDLDPQEPLPGLIPEHEEPLPLTG